MAHLSTLVPRDTAIMFSLYAFLTWVIWRILRVGSRRSSMPPGPPPLPFFGNLFSLPLERPHLKFTEWAHQYGDVVSLTALHHTYIVLNTPSAVKAAIDKESSSSSDRPKSVISERIIPDGTSFGTARHADETWKVLRKLAAQLLGAENFRKYAELQLAEANQMMLDFACDPEDWYNHVHRFTTSFALAIVYGVRVPTTGSHRISTFIDLHHRYLHALGIGTLPPVDLFPILKLVPERWANWKRVVRDIRELHQEYYGDLLNIVTSRLGSGRENGSFLEGVIPNAQLLGIDDQEILMNLGAILIQGSDTTSAAMQNFILCAVAFPQAQAKAREEIDRVIGRNRAPAWADIVKLPYTKAFLEECNRFRPVGPLCLPHAMSQDKIINGLLYPKDAVLFINLWGMYHDERYFELPDEFVPERFLDTPHGVKQGITDDPARRPNMMFGGGRRVCPGVSFAQPSLEITAVNLLWAFELLPMIDSSTGKAVFPSLSDYSTGVTATPRPTKIRIVPRSSKHLDIIRSNHAEFRTLFSHYEQDDQSELAAPSSSAQVHPTV